MLNLLGVLVSFIIIIFLIRKKFNFGLSLIFGALIIGIFSLTEVSLIEIPKAFVEALIYSFKEESFNFETIELAVLLTLIYILAKSMQETKAIDKLIKSLSTIFYKGGTIAVIPAIYGLMPVPGGALFSAPLIDKEGEKYGLNQDKKNFLNVWFRHIWFPIFPVSSAMILIVGAKFSNIQIYELIIANFPAFITFIVIGLIFLKIYIKRNPKIDKPPKKNYLGLIYLLPPIIPIIFYIIFFVFTAIIGFDNQKDYQRIIFVIGVIISIILLYYLIKNPWSEYKLIIKKSLTFNLALAIIGIMIFRQFIEISNANEILKDIIANLAFPPVLIIILIPLILGLITGYNFGAIALSYILIVDFFELTNINIVGITSLIFISSLVGYLISPIHLCNVVSSDYLKTDTTRMYKMYIPAVIVLLSVQTIFLLIFYHI
jgi:integral membrane protein (TIGR00529 family)